MKILFYFLLFSCLSITSIAQSKADTVLYLHFKEGKNPHASKGQRSILPNGVNMQSTYRTGLHLYDGYPLYFISLDRENAERVKLHQLKKYPVVSLKELEQFIIENYKKDYIGYQGREYFRKLKHIYIVEKNEEEGIATITEVELDITIE